SVLRVKKGEWERERHKNEKEREKMMTVSVRKLQLEIEYRHAKQEYVTKYQEYITNLEDETARQAEIEQLRTFIKSKLDKEEKQQLDNRPFQSLVDSTEVYD
ncbi:AGAP008897-PA, partial [Anopheles gambiae str. PEST]